MHQSVMKIRDCAAWYRAGVSVGVCVRVCVCVLWVGLKASRLERVMNRPEVVPPIDVPARPDTVGSWRGEGSDPLVETGGFRPGLEFG